MAQRTLIVMEDDLDGTEASQTITFAVGSSQYEIDLSDKNADRFHKALAPYVDAGRKIRGSGRGRRGGNGSSGKAELAEIREWARGQGLHVSERGRISAEVREAYAAAH